MKKKIFLGINTFLLVTVLISLFLPIDSLYIYAINIGLGILSLFFIFATFFIKREKQFLFLFLLQFGGLLFCLLLIGCHYSPYRIGWKFYLCILIFPISFSEFSLANQLVLNKRKVLLFCFIILQSFIFVKSLFFTQFYEFEGNKEYGEDIRNFSENGQYKVLNQHKLLNKNPEKLTDEDYNAISSLINSSDWLKDNYPKYSNISANSLDVECIKKNIKYSFSVIHFNEFFKADFYKLSIPLEKRWKKISVYIPKGEFYLSAEDFLTYEKYYNIIPKETSYTCYKGLGLPYNQKTYESYINNYFN
ncbi:hypothetical protein [Treponema succinifaciens]|uniref:Uncharacterized protein n=1 Tax=Treponema succinifaciens (strain ATCC 33096 / DSM 2489 / 6091) TaxID=869209 RepID=F2NYG1_TRES6|nr:hypothetical protein [Treponema succinifaciens]AEB15460.1 hypothetical protein Tresu_2598 [Treponema succinifaciens DSM 2489]